MEHTTNQANRVALVSDALDALSPGRADIVWDKARNIYKHEDVSFLQALETAIASEREKRARDEAYDSAYCREHDC